MKYKYGVEYPNNGNRPDLPSDVTIQWRGLGPWSMSYVGILNWSLLGEHTKVKFFRIVDQRYKPVTEQPAETKQDDWSFCPECGSESIRYKEGDHRQCGNCFQEYFSDVDHTAVVMAHLSDYSKIRKQQEYNKPMSKSEPEMSKECLNDFPSVGCLAEHITWGMPIRIKFLGEKLFIAEKTDASIGADREVCGFVQDLRPAKTEREKFVERVCTALHYTHSDEHADLASALYDAGFRAPD